MSAAYNKTTLLRLHQVGAPTTCAAGGRHSPARNRTPTTTKAPLSHFTCNHKIFAGLAENVAALGTVPHAGIAEDGVAEGALLVAVVANGLHTGGTTRSLMRAQAGQGVFR